MKKKCKHEGQLFIGFVNGVRVFWCDTKGCGAIKYFGRWRLPGKRKVRKRSK